MVLEPLSPGRREVVTSGGERDRRQAWTHDITPPLRNGFQTFSSAQQGERQSGGGGSRGRGPGDRGRYGCQGGAGRAGGP